MSISEKLHRASREIAFFMLPKKDPEKIEKIAALLSVKPQILAIKLREKNIYWLTNKIEQQKVPVLQTLKNMFKKDRHV